MPVFDPRVASGVQLLAWWLRGNHCPGSTLLLANRSSPAVEPQATDKSALKAVAMSILAATPSADADSAISEPRPFWLTEAEKSAAIEYATSPGTVSSEANERSTLPSRQLLGSCSDGGINVTGEPVGRSSKHAGTTDCSSRYVSSLGSRAYTATWSSLIGSFEQALDCGRRARACGCVCVCARAWGFV